MELSFSSRQELYLRVRPALSAKIQELRRQGYNDVSELDIWNCLIEKKWLKGHALMLSDVVSDILHVEFKTIHKYQRNKHREEQEKNKNRSLEVI